MGFSAFFAEQLSKAEHAGGIPARIAAEHRGGYEVWASSSEGPAQLAGKLRASLEREALPGVGDWVLVREAPAPDRTAIIERVLERRTVFTRGAVGRPVRLQVIAANVDLLFVVCGLDGDFNLHRIERYLSRIWAGGATPIVLLNKADLCEQSAARTLEVEMRCRGVAIHAISALHAEGLEVVRAALRPGLTAAFVGSSGAGKSTLVNALLGEELMLTGAVRAHDGRGRHVTTHRQLVLLPGGGLLLDTPGMRELQLVDSDGIDAVFPELAPLASRCRFRDCRHAGEPGCAVQAAVEAGELSSDRLEHYRTLEREAQAFERRHDERLRRQSGRVWGQLYEEALRIRRWKESE
ncbi:MAG: ribosome small subunit-dependent GTPase A [Deltaproteobacteria bacterium RIFOXYA12_FULL_61_11]|nr:MAG: ribosome small subunit-dependent GTPase A [Deltaproteobacteria bacterium RIFOXYA12_FULL_61_11]